MTLQLQLLKRCTRSLSKPRSYEETMRWRGAPAPEPRPAATTPLAPPGCVAIPRARVVDPDGPLTFWDHREARCGRPQMTSFPPGSGPLERFPGASSPPPLAADSSRGEVPGALAPCRRGAPVTSPSVRGVSGCAPARCAVCWSRPRRRPSTRPPGVPACRPPACHHACPRRPRGPAPRWPLLLPRPPNRVPRRSRAATGCLGSARCALRRHGHAAPVGRRHPPTVTPGTGEALGPPWTNVGLGLGARRRPRTPRPCSRQRDGQAQALEYPSAHTRVGASLRARPGGLHGRGRSACGAGGGGERLRHHQERPGHGRHRRARPYRPAHHPPCPRGSARSAPPHRAAGGPHRHGCPSSSQTHVGPQAAGDAGDQPPAHGRARPPPRGLLALWGQGRGGVRHGVTDRRVAATLVPALRCGPPHASVGPGTGCAGRWPLVLNVSRTLSVVRRWRHRDLTPCGLRSPGGMVPPSCGRGRHRASPRATSAAGTHRERSSTVVRTKHSGTSCRR